MTNEEIKNEEWVKKELEEGYSNPICLKLITILLAKIVDYYEKK